MKNALAYARVSTKEQAEKGLSTAQLKALREYANSHGFRILEAFSFKLRKTRYLGL